MGGRGSSSGKVSKVGGGSTSKASKSGGKTVTLHDIKKGLTGTNINSDIKKLQSMMDSAKVGTSFEFSNNPYHSDVKDTYTKTSKSKWTFTHSYRGGSWSTEATASQLWNDIYS